MKIVNLKIFFVFIPFLLLHLSTFSNNLSVIDSLRRVLENTKEDTVRLQTYLSLCEASEVGDNLKYADTAIKLADVLLAQTTNEKTREYILKRKAHAIELKLYYYRTKGDSINVFKCYHEALFIYDSIKDKDGVISCISNIAAYYNEQGNISKELEMFQKGLKMSQEIYYINGIALWTRAMARLFGNQGEYNQAIINYESALASYSKNKDTTMIVRTLRDIAKIYGQMKDTLKANQYFQRAITMFNKLGDQEGVLLTYNAMGLMYAKIPDDEKALLSYEKSLQIAEVFGENKFIRAVLGNIGDIYRRKNDMEKALYFHNRSLQVARKIEVIEGQRAWVWHQLAQDYFILKNYKIAKAFMDSNLVVTLKVQVGGYNELKRDGLFLAAQIDSACGNFQNAYLHYQQYIYWRDKLSNEEVRKVAVKEKFQTDYNDQKAKDKAEQEKKDAIVQQQIQKQKIIRNSFIAGSILLLLLIVVLINRNKLKRSIEMEKMRSRLSRDLHDDIGSTLSSINILSRTAQSNLKQSQDDKTKVSLEKINERSQRLLDNMSDIIWNIHPGNDTIEEVMSRMREYSTTVLEAKNIDYTFDFPKEKIDCTLTMEVKNNMYLIFKEAVNNLSKYSGASKANLSLTFDEKNIHLKIEDNGHGFELSTNESGVFSSPLGRSGGAGLRNMQHRAEEIKGALKINSVPGEGTVIELIMPRYC